MCAALFSDGCARVRCGERGANRRVDPPAPPLARVQALRAFLISVSQVKSRRVLRCHAVGLSDGGSFGVGDQREQSKRFTPRCGRDRHLARKGRENKPTGNAQGARRGGVRQTPHNPPTLEGINQFIQSSNPSTPPSPQHSGLSSAPTVPRVGGFDWPAARATQQ